MLILCTLSRVCGFGFCWWSFFLTIFSNEDRLQMFKKLRKQCCFKVCAMFVFLFRECLLWMLPGIFLGCVVIILHSEYVSHATMLIYVVSRFYYISLLEDGGRLGYSTVCSRSRPMFQRCVLPPLSGWWWRQYTPLKLPCWSSGYCACCWTQGTRVRTRPRRWICKGDRNPQPTFFRMGSKAGGPML
jgi:hypothetical protein